MGATASRRALRAPLATPRLCVRSREHVVLVPANAVSRCQLAGQGAGAVRLFGGVIERQVDRAADSEPDELRPPTVFCGRNAFEVSSAPIVELDENLLQYRTTYTPPNGARKFGRGAHTWSDFESTPRATVRRLSKGLALRPLSASRFDGCSAIDTPSLAGLMGAACCVEGRNPTRPPRAGAGFWASRQP